MGYGAACGGGLNGVAVGAAQQCGGHCKAHGQAGDQSAHEYHNQGASHVYDEETYSEEQESAAEGIVVKLALGGAEEGTGQHAAHQEDAHCGSGHGRGTKITVIYNKGYVGAEDGIGGDEHEDNAAVQPGLFGNVQVAAGFLVSLCSGLILGQVDAAEHQGDEAKEVSQVSVMPVDSSQHAAYKGEVDAAAVGEGVLNAHDCAALGFIVVLGNNAVGGRHQKTEAQAQDYLPGVKLEYASMEEEAQKCYGCIAAHADLAKDFLGDLGGKQSRDEAADEHCKTGEVGHGLDKGSRCIREGGLNGSQSGLEPHTAHLQSGDKEYGQGHHFSAFNFSYVFHNTFLFSISCFKHPEPY